jgi:hypothetical protein
MSRLAFFLCAAMASMLSPPATSAADAVPKQLLGKTVVVAWSTIVRQKGPDGRIIAPRMESANTVYISTAGRLFVQSSRRAPSGQSSLGEVGPGDTKSSSGGASQASFQGDRLVLIRGFAVGANRMIVSFAPGYQSCSAESVVGREGGKQVRRGVDGRMYEILATELVSMNCSIKDGNALTAR